MFYIFDDFENSCFFENARNNPIVETTTKVTLVTRGVSQNLIYLRFSTVWNEKYHSYAYRVYITRNIRVRSNFSDSFMHLSYNVLKKNIWNKTHLRVKVRECCGASYRKHETLLNKAFLGDCVAHKFPIALDDHAYYQRESFFKYVQYLCTTRHHKCAGITRFMKGLPREEIKVLHAKSKVRSGGSAARASVVARIEGVRESHYAVKPLAIRHSS